MLSQEEFEAMIADTGKTIEGDLRWSPDSDHGAVEFRAKIRSSAGYPLQVNGRYSAYAETLSFTLIHQSVGRVYALDLGARHRNPDGSIVGPKHKHRWQQRYRDKVAYEPRDITEPWTRPVDVWKQFCEEARIVHNGVLSPPQEGILV